jgi:hypothetical protein
MPAFAVDIPFPEANSAALDWARPMANWKASRVPSLGSTPIKSAECPCHSKIGCVFFLAAASRFSMRGTLILKLPPRLMFVRALGGHKEIKLKEELLLERDHLGGMRSVYSHGCVLVSPKIELDRGI